MDLLTQMVNGGWSRLPNPEDAEDTEYRLRYTKTDILHSKKKTVSEMLSGANISQSFAVVQTLR